MAVRGLLVDGLRRWRHEHARTAVFAHVAAQWRMRPVPGYLRQWRSMALLQTRSQGMARRVLDRIRRTGIDAAMQALGRNAAARRRLQALRVRLGAGALFGALRAWQAAAAAWSEVTTRLGRAVQLWLSTEVRAAWHGWRQGCEVRRRLRRVAAAWLLRALASCVRRWQAAQSADFAARALLGSAAPRAVRGLLSDGLRRWRREHARTAVFA